MIKKRKIEKNIGLFHFLSLRGWTNFSRQGGIDPKISRGFLMKIKKFPGPNRKNIGKFQGVQLQKFPGH